MKDVDGVLHDHTALDRHIVQFAEKLTASDDGAEAALTGLADEMQTHMADEEGRLFERAAQVLGNDDPGLGELREQHAALKNLLEEVRAAAPADRKAAFEHVVHRRDGLGTV